MAQIRLKAKKADTMRDTQSRRQFGKFRLQRTCASDDKPRRAGRAGESAKESGIILYRFQTAGSKPKKMILQAKFTAQALPHRGIGAPGFKIYAVYNTARFLFEVMRVEMWAWATAWLTAVTRSGSQRLQR